jgi:hypothetical protein
MNKYDVQKRVTFKKSSQSSKRSKKSITKETTPTPSGDAKKVELNRVLNDIAN